ncbi:MAG: 4Fe-4S binding protein, partial [Desulfobacteraceae bacterium]|nr:4Fe-4S binding protein [Desulfobacteraceae bacterium]
MAMSTVSWAPVVIDPKVCTGCNECVKVCTNGVLLPNPEKGKPPIVA